MSNISDIIDVQMRFEDEDTATRLRGQILTLEKSIRALYDQFKSTPDNFRAAAAAQVDQLKQLRDALDDLEGRPARRAAADKQAAQDSARVAKEQAAARKQAARDWAEVVRQSERDAAREARQTAAEQKQAARDAARAKIQAARDAAAAAKVAAREEIEAARRAMDEVIDAANAEKAARLAAARASGGPTILSGADRAGAKARLGLAGANILQDAIQGGPASTINNILGLAGDGGARALGGEFLAAAGGVRGLAVSFGSLAVAAGAAFLVIDGGPNKAKLGWGDLGAVVDEMAGGAFSGISKSIGDGFKEVYNWAGDLVGTVADYTIGWTKATDAVRDHKEELERNAKILKEQIADQKFLGTLKSDAQTEGERRGKLFGTALANLAGPKGIEDLIDRLVTDRIGAGDGKKTKIQVPELDKKGDPTGKTKEVEVTQRQQLAETYAGLIRGASDRGEQATMDALVRTLRAAGLDVTGVENAAKGVDPKDTKKQEKKDETEAKAKAKKEADEDRRDMQHHQEQEQKHREAFAKWQMEEQKKLDDESAAARNADLMADWKRRREEGQRNTQVFEGATTLRDAIQQSYQRANRDPTQTEQLAVMKVIEANTKRMAEAKAAAQTARAG